MGQSGTGVAMPLRRRVRMELPLHPTEPETDMTTEQKVARRKRSLIELATELGNVSKARASGRMERNARALDCLLNERISDRGRHYQIDRSLEERL